METAYQKQIKAAKFWKFQPAMIARSVVGIVFLFLALMAVAYFRYFSPKAADLPCRGCTGEARSVEVNNFDLYYRSVGERGRQPPVVLLHGGPGMSSQTFKKSFDFLADNGYEVIYYDQRGSGNSQIRPELDYYSIDQLVAELETLRRDVIQAEQIILMGHSAGGALAQRYALEYPNRVEKMILVAALPANGGFETSWFGLDAFLALINMVSGNLPPADPQAADRWIGEVGYQTSIARLYDPAHPETIQDFGYMSFAVNRELTRSTFGGSFDERLQQLPVPTLVIYGDADRSDFTGPAMAQHFHDVLPNSVLVRFERSGHWPYLEEPERFRQVLIDFLAQAATSED